MSYQARVLPPEEWPRLAGTEAELVWPHLHPADARVLVVEQDTAIVGTLVLFRAVHAECAWIAPHLRRRAPGVVRRLVTGMHQVASGWDARTLCAGAMSDEMQQVIEKVGGHRLPGQMYVLPVVSRGD